MLLFLWNIIYPKVNKVIPSGPLQLQLSAQCSLSLWRQNVSTVQMRKTCGALQMQLNILNIRNTRFF